MIFTVSLNLNIYKEVSRMRLTHVSGDLFVDELSRQWRRYLLKDTYAYELIYNPATGTNR